jgi:hypothetical protein
MTKNEIELIIFKVSADGQDAINMKIYKNGTTCRYGAGGLPQLGISAMSFFNDARFFDPLIAKIPDDVLEKPLMYEEETPNGYLEYVIAFYGVSKNGDTGERADWAKSTGIRVKLDHQSTFKHPIMGLLDGLTMDAAELTNEWYFDVAIFAEYKMQSSTIPKETIFALPKTDKEIHKDFENYINQMLASARSWSMVNFGKDKIYERDGKNYKGMIQESKQAFSINFIPLDNNSHTNQADKKPWWKVW